MQDDVRGLHVFVADSTPLYTRAYAAPLIAFVVLLVVDWRLALVAAAVLAVGMVIFDLVMRGAGESTAAYNAAREQVNVALVEICAGDAGGAHLRRRRNQLRPLPARAG